MVRRQDSIGCLFDNGGDTALGLDPILTGRFWLITYFANSAFIPYLGTTPQLPHHIVGFIERRAPTARTRSFVFPRYCQFCKMALASGLIYFA